MGVNNPGINIFAGVPAPGELKITGRVFYVGNSSTYVPGGVAGVDDPSHGDTPQRPFATWDYAIGQCTAGRGDALFLLPGHAETISATVAMDVAGVRVFGLGVAANRATITFDNSAGVVAVSAANCEIAGVNFVCNVASQTRMIDLQGGGDGCYIHDCQFREGSATGLSMVEWTGAADDVRIESNTFYAPTAGNYDEAILIASTPTRGHILKNFIYGDFDEGAINNATGNVATLFEISENTITNLLSGAEAIDLDSAVTGVISNNALSTDAIGTAIDQGSMRCLGNKWASTTDGTSGVDVPATPADTTTADTILGALFGTGGISSFPSSAAPANNVSMAEVLRDTWDVLRNGTGGAEPATNRSIMDYMGVTPAFFVPGLGYKVSKSHNIATDNVDLFTVTGKCMITLLAGEVTTIVATTTTYAMRVKTTTEAIFPATTITTDAAGTMYLFGGDPTVVLNNGGTPTTRVGFLDGAGPISPLVVGLAGGSLTIESDLDGAGTGVIAWDLFYLPLEAGASIAAA